MAGRIQFQWVSCILAVFLERPMCKNMENSARAAALIAGALTSESSQRPSELADLLDVSPRPAYMSVALRVSHAGDGSSADVGGTTATGSGFVACTSNLLSSPTCTFSIHILHDTFVGRVMSGRRPALARATATGR